MRDLVYDSPKVYMVHALYRYEDLLEPKPKFSRKGFQDKVLI